MVATSAAPIVALPNRSVPRSHLQGMLSRTIRLLEAGVKPVFVFDGKPPAMKEEEVSPPAPL